MSAAHGIVVKTIGGPRVVFPLEQIGNFAIHHTLVAGGVKLEQFSVTHVPSGYMIPLRVDENGDLWVLKSLEAARAWLELFRFRGGEYCIHQNDDGNWSMSKRGQAILKILAAQVTFNEE